MQSGFLKIVILYLLYKFTLHPRVLHIDLFK